MESDFDLQSYSDYIEDILCKMDREYDFSLKDEVALDIYKLLMNKYYFKDKELLFKSEITQNGFKRIDEGIERNSFDNDTLTKILSLLYFVANRRSKGEREYFEFIHHYVGGGNGVMRITGYE